MAINKNITVKRDGKLDLKYRTKQNLRTLFEGFCDFWDYLESFK